MFPILNPPPFSLPIPSLLPVLSYGMQTLSCSMWDLVPWPGIESRPPALGLWSFSHWTTREVPIFVSNTTASDDCYQSKGPGSSPHSQGFWFFLLPFKLIKRVCPVVHSQNGPDRGWISTHFLHRVPSYLESRGLGGQGKTLELYFLASSLMRGYPCPLPRAWFRKTDKILESQPIF